MKLLIVMTSHDTIGVNQKTGVYLSELTHALHVFEREQIEIDLVSPKGGRPPFDGLDVNDNLNQLFLDDANWNNRLAKTSRLDQVNPSLYCGVYVPGGHGTMFDFPNNNDLSPIIGSIYDRGGVVSAVCHGPAALINVTLKNGNYLVHGKNISVFTNEEEECMKMTEAMPFLLETKLVERGAIIKKAAPFQKQISVSERLVTGQNPASAMEVAEQVVTLLKAR